MCKVLPDGLSASAADGGGKEARRRVRYGRVISSVTALALPLRYLTKTPWWVSDCPGDITDEILTGSAVLMGRTWMGPKVFVSVVSTT